MNIEEYSVLAMRTADLSNSPVLHAAMGMAGEAGEVMDIVKKMVFYKKPMERERLLEEIGDQIWYTNLMIQALESSWSAVLEANIAKLEARYPDLRFDPEKAISQNKEAEQAAINQVL